MRLHADFNSDDLDGGRVGQRGNYEGIVAAQDRLGRAGELPGADARGEQIGGGVIGGALARHPVDFHDEVDIDCGGVIEAEDEGVRVVFQHGAKVEQGL